MKLAACLGVLALCLAAAAYPARNAETAMSADAFVDTVGVNTHLHYLNTSYANFPAVESALKELGVRHIRDEMADGSWPAYDEELNQLGRVGVKAILTTLVKENDALLIDYPRRVRDSFEGYEGPNEYDLSGHPNWAETLNTFCAKLYRAVKSDPTASQFPIIAPPLVKSQSYALVASTHEFVDYANLHNYFGGHNPGSQGWGANNYGSYGWNLNNAGQAWPGKPIITTETGYYNDLNKEQGIPESVSAKYLPRVLLEQAMHGIRRTYIYELADVGSKEKFKDATFGLLHADFSEKPGFRTVQGLLRVLSDPGPAFQAGTLEFSLGGSLTNVHHFLLEKRDGTFYLALWVEESGYDVKGKRETPIASRNVTIQTKDAMKMIAHRFDDDGQMRESSLGSGQTQSLQIDDHVVIVEMAK